MVVTCLYLLSILLTDAAAMSAVEGITSSKVILKREVETSCEKGWYPFKDKCYKTGGIKEMRLNWEKSADRCRELGATLASIHSAEQLDFLTAFILMNVQDTTWIGLNDRTNESQYQWDDGSDVDFTNWEPEEPSGAALEHEDCAEFLYRSGRKNGKPGMWNDIDCGAEREFICQKQGRIQAARRGTDPRFCPPPTGGWNLRKSCYHIVTKKLTWEEAEKYCTEIHGGHLVTINDFSVNLFIEYIAKNYTEDMWIGLKFKNEYQQQWSSGWYVAFTDWLEEPGVFLDGTCAIRTLDKWTVVPCTRRLPFICEISSEPIPLLTSSEQLSCPDEPPGWRDLKGDFCYHFEYDHLTWFEANFRCLRRGGTLASFHSQTELEIVQPFMMTHFVKSRLFNWIGLHRHMRYEEEFGWVDGSPLDFKAWGNTEPNNEREQCGEVNPQSLKWNDYFCDHPRPSVCSVRKMTSNQTTGSTIESPACPSGFSTEALLGVIFCILFVAILLGTVVYCIYRQDKEERQKRKTFLLTLPARLREQKHKYLPNNEIIIVDDSYDMIRPH